MIQTVCRRRSQLDQLAALHRQATLGGTAAGSVKRVRVRAKVLPEGRWRLDLPAWRQNLDIRLWLDLEISGPPSSPDNRALLVHLEDAPHHVVAVDPSATPPWLRVLSVAS